jgi:D-alanine transaminase
VFAYLNGQFLPRAAAMVPVEDRGFIFGDGVYEVWRVVEGRLFEADRHLERLAYGLRELRLPAPDIARAETLHEVADRLLRESTLTTGEATLYLQVTRGAAPRTHQFPPAGTAPTVYATVNKLTLPHDVRARGAQCVTLTDMRWMRCDIKTLQLLPNVLAMQSAVEHGVTDAIFLRDGMVTESSHANVLGVVDGVVCTHPANNLILPGITRAVVLEIAGSLGIPVREEAFSAQDMMDLDELFLTGTTNDVMPVVRVDDQPIGNGAPGPITMRLYDAFRAHLDSGRSLDARAANSPAGAVRAVTPR